MNRAVFGVPALAGCAPSGGRDRLKPGLQTSSCVAGQDTSPSPPAREPASASLDTSVSRPIVREKMFSQDSADNSEEPPLCQLLGTLKTFRSAGRGFWADVPDSQWNDWHWQLKHR